MRKSVALSSLAIILVALLLAVLPHLFLPKRWLDIHPGQERAKVHLVLGMPDADYFGGKSFDSWFNPFGYGASCLTILYDDQAKVERVIIDTDWGFEHRTWAQDYKSVLTDSEQGSRLGP